MLCCWWALAHVLCTLWDTILLQRCSRPATFVAGSTAINGCCHRNRYNLMSSLLLLQVVGGGGAWCAALAVL